MDLFTLVAKLTLDPKEYEKELKTAERKAASAKMDAKGTISASDQFTGRLSQAEDAAKHFDGHAQGTISANDQFSGAMDAAGHKAEHYDANAQGTISTDDQFSGAMDSDERKAGNYDAEAQGIISADDQFSAGMESAETKAADAQLNAQGELSADDQYTGDLGAAETSAGAANLDVSGTLTAYDDYGETLGTAENEATTADLDVEGAITLTDEYSEELGDIEGDASSSDLNVEGTATLTHTEFDESISNMTEQVQGLDSLLKGLKVAGVVAGIGAAASWAYGVITDTTQYADRVDKTSQQLGMSYQAFQEWDHALSQSGATIEGMKRGMLNITDYMVGEDVPEDVTNAYASLSEATGISFDPSEYSSKEDLFNATIMALASMEAGAERDAIVTGIFGRQGTMLNPMLNTGPEEIQRLIDEAHELGLVMEDADVVENVKLGDDLANLNASVKALLMSVASDIAPGVIAVVEFLVDIIKTIRKKWGISDGVFETPADALDYVRKKGQQMNGTVAESGSEEAVEAESGQGGWVPVSVGSGLAGTDVYYDPISGRYLNVTHFGQSISAATVSPEGGETDNLANGWARMGAMMGQEVEMWGGNPLFGGLLGFFHLLGTGIMDTALDFVPPSTADTGYQMVGADLHGGSVMRVGLNDDGTVRLADPYEQPVEQAVDKTKHRRPGPEEPREVDISKETEAIYARNKRRILEALLGPIADEDWGSFTRYGIGNYKQLGSADMQVSDVDMAAGTVTLTDGTVEVKVKLNFGGYGPLNEEGEYKYYLEKPGSHAKGLWDVPYDDYAALLHRDEMVLTASQAREYREGGEDSSLASAIQDLRTDMANLKIVVGEKAFGQTVVDYSGRRMRGYMGKAENRQYAGHGWG